MNEKVVLQVAGTTGTAVALFSDNDLEEKDEGSVVRLPRTVWDELDRISVIERQRALIQKPNAKKVSRNDVIKKVLIDFIERYQSDEQAESERKPRKHKT
jgi:virulence-associated protein VagC